MTEQEQLKLVSYDEYAVQSDWLESSHWITD